MGEVPESRTTQFRKFASNPHFWAITFIMAALITFYNASYIGVSGWFPRLEEVFGREFIYDFRRSLFLIPLLYAAFVFRFRGTVVCWLVFLVAVMPRALYFSPYPVPTLRTVLFAAVALLAALLLAFERNRREREREAYVKLGRVHNTYATQVLQAQENERKRITQDLHDSIQQHLVFIANQSHNLASGGSGRLPSAAKAEAERIRDLALHTADEVRRISHDLRPSILDHLGFVASLRWLSDYSSPGSEAASKIIVIGEEWRLNPEAELIFFRIAQEALNNTMRHSQASQAEITLKFAPDSVQLTVWDNGKGFAHPEEMHDFALDGKLELKGVQERAKLLGATLNIQSELGKGTTITVEARV